MFLCIPWVAPAAARPPRRRTVVVDLGRWSWQRHARRRPGRRRRCRRPPENHRLRLRTDVDRGELRRALDQAMARAELRQPVVAEEAVRELKFAEILPPDLAVRTLAARLGDEPAARRVGPTGSNGRRSPIRNGERCACRAWSLWRITPELVCRARTSAYVA
ncbi:MAG TPA: hypothetical protein VMU34_06870 [Mycobacterium sp.]|nr:hypothetical protein [Mycobacterium sp.]